MIRIKFPSGSIAYQLLKYMGIDYIEERPEVAQRLVKKCESGTTIYLERDELNQLIKDVENTLDIKQDHVGHGDWSALQQHHLRKFLSKIRSI